MPLARPCQVRANHQHHAVCRGARCCRCGNALSRCIRHRIVDAFRGAHICAVLPHRVDHGAVGPVAGVATIVPSDGLGQVDVRTYDCHRPDGLGLDAAAGRTRARARRERQRPGLVFDQHRALPRPFPRGRQGPRRADGAGRDLVERAERVEVRQPHPHPQRVAKALIHVIFRNEAFVQRGLCVRGHEPSAVDVGSRPQHIPDGLLRSQSVVVVEVHVGIGVTVRCEAYERLF